MATAALQPSPGRDRFFRVATLLIDGGLPIIRGLFDSIHHPSNLVNALQINRCALNQLKARRFLSQVEWNILFPSSSCYGKSKNFDLTLLFKLLRNVCNLTAPSSGWDVLPRATDLCVEADITRVKYHRNETYAHISSSKMELSVDKFNDCWEQIKGALLRIVGKHSAPSTVREWEDQIEKSRTGPITVDDINNYLSGFPVIVVKCILKVAKAGSFIVVNFLEKYKENLKSLLERIQHAIFPTGRITVEAIHEGSLVIELRIKDLDALEDFWRRYQSNELRNSLEQLLVTEEIRRLSDKAELTVMTVTVSEDEYLHARYFLEELIPHTEKEIATAASFQVEKKVEEVTEAFQLSLDVVQRTPMAERGFSKQQALAFVGNYFQYNEEVKAKALEIIKDNQFLLSFCSVPLMCLSMCVYMESSDVVPIRVTHLYSEVIQYIEIMYNTAILGSSLDKSTASLKAHHKNLEKLSELAAKLFVHDKSSFDEEELKQLSISKDELTYLKSSSLLSKVSEHAHVYRFIHSTIQEYLAARHFVKIKDMPAKDIQSGIFSQFFAGSLDTTKDEVLMNRLLERIDKLDESGYEQRSLSLKCLYEYADNEYVKNVVQKNQHNRYWDNDGWILLDAIDYQFVVMLVDTITKLNQEQSLPKTSHVPYRLGIRFSPLTLSGVKTLFTSLSKEFCTITHLSLWWCDINDECVEELGKYLPAMKLSTLDLSDNKITDDISVLTMIPYCKNLRRLHLHKNEMRPDKCKKHVRKLFKEKYPNIKFSI